MPAPPHDAPYDFRLHAAAAATHAREFAEYASQYASSRVSAATLVAKRTTLLVLLLALVGVILLTVLVTSAVLLVVGIAGALAAPLPVGFQWLGSLVVGLAGTVGVPLAAWVVMRRLAGGGKARALDDYNARLRAQRERFAVNARDRAATPAGGTP